MEHFPKEKPIVVVLYDAFQEKEIRTVLNKAEIALGQQGISFCKMSIQSQDSLAELWGASSFNSPVSYLFKDGRQLMKLEEETNYETIVDNVKQSV